MKLFDYASFKDYGKEYYLNILQIKKFCLLQSTLEFNPYSGTSGLIVNIGHSSLIGFDLQIGKFSFSADFICWICRNLNQYREEYNIK
jgi:hypothetical protein